MAENEAASTIIPDETSHLSFEELKQRSVDAKFKMAIFGGIGGSALFGTFTAIAAKAIAGGAFMAMSWPVVAGLMACGILFTYLSQKQSSIAMTCDQELGARKFVHNQSKLNQPSVSQEKLADAEHSATPSPPDVTYPQNRRADGRPWLTVVNGKPEDQSLNKQQSLGK